MLFIDNQNSTAQEIISEYLEWSERVDIAVAFLRKSGIDLVDSSIKRLLDKHGKIRVLVGRDFGFTDPDTLLCLKSLGTHVKVFKSDLIFHPVELKFKM